jgi:guanosine-3',5'-bis(diphosphate) 3'-pyrophosphohydrolase
MKSIFSLLFSFSLFFSTLCATPTLSDQFAKTREVISHYSHAHSSVLATAKTFLDELHNCYSAGEQMIDKDIVRILAAVQFAAEKHQFQTRKDSDETPYIIHPIGVAYHLLTRGHVRDPDILIGALLHDTVEDTQTSFEEIQALFGTRVEGFVREVTDDKSLPKMERKKQQILHAKDKSAGAAQIKLGDKFYNLNDLLHSPPPDWEEERIVAYFEWAKQVVDGLPWVNGELKSAVDHCLASASCATSR